MKVDFPKALKCVKTEVTSVVVELNRLVAHNRAVYQDLYGAIIDDKIHAPVFMTESDGVPDPTIKKTVAVLRAKPTKEAVMTRVGENQKLEPLMDGNGRLIVEKEDGPVVETTPEIEAMIDEIIDEADIQDDFDEYANISEAEARNLIQALARPDSAMIVRILLSIKLIYFLFIIPANAQVMFFDVAQANGKRGGVEATCDGEEEED
jgi:hypothetical protein